MNRHTDAVQPTKGRHSVPVPVNSFFFFGEIRPCQLRYVNVLQCNFTTSKFIHISTRNTYLEFK